MNQTGHRPPTFIRDVELTSPFPDHADLDDYGDAQLLCRLNGAPIAVVKVPIEAGRLPHRQMVRELLDGHGWTFAPLLARQAIADGHPPAAIEVERLLTATPAPAPAPAPAPMPLVTVAVCTRDRPADLRRCLDALTALQYPALDLLVVENAPATDQTESLVRDHYPTVRYVCEPRPGLNWARSRAILECRGEILAYTDDDVVVDSGWVSALVRVFQSTAHVMAVTGLVVPFELETDAQRMFETYGGFGRGFARRWYRAPAGRPLAPVHGGTGKFGTGANMAFRRAWFGEAGGFDPALDVGTRTNGGGDLEMFFRVLKAGHTLVYEPAAIVRHCHRRTHAQLETQIANNGVGFYSYLVRTAQTYGDERAAVARLGLWWLRWWNLRRLTRGLLGKEQVPVALMRGELAGSLRGLGRYRQACARAERIRRDYPAEPELPVRNPVDPRGRRVPEAVRRLDLAQPLTALTDAADYERLRLLVAWDGQPLGSVTIEHHGADVSAEWLADAIAAGLSREILDADTRLGPHVFWAGLITALAAAFTARLATAGAGTAAPVWRPLPLDIPVSIVVATYDRPADLARCLDGLCGQRSDRPVEILVVDNHPDSGLTAPVVARFPAVRLLEETRGGLSYARNRGIAAAGGEIIVATDDDVVCPPEWIERLVSPFREGDVMVVTGNVLPIELGTDAQRLFEAYGGLGRGFMRARFDADWFNRWRRAPPTWELGCTANAAFRAAIFRRPEIGLMDEALGAGTPTGCSEDTYVFYRVLKAGHSIVYEPDAWVWHRHRTTMAALRRQIYAYAKGHVAYQLTTWQRDGDVRGLLRVVYELPRTYARRAWERVRGRSEYPLPFIALEVLGTLAGPFALWRSRRRVSRLGRSAPPQTGRPAAAAKGAAERAADRAPDTAAVA